MSSDLPHSGLKNLSTVLGPQRPVQPRHRKERLSVEAAERGGVWWQQRGAAYGGSSEGPLDARARTPTRTPLCKRMQTGAVCREGRAVCGGSREEPYAARGRVQRGAGVCGGRDNGRSATVPRALRATYTHTSIHVHTLGAVLDVLALLVHFARGEQLVDTVGLAGGLAVDVLIQEEVERMLLARNSVVAVLRRVLSGHQRVHESVNLVVLPVGVRLVNGKAVVQIVTATEFVVSHLLVTLLMTFKDTFLGEYIAHSHGDPVEIVVMSVLFLLSTVLPSVLTLIIMAGMSKFALRVLHAAKTEAVHECTDALMHDDEAQGEKDDNQQSRSCKGI